MPRTGLTPAVDPGGIGPGRGNCIDDADVLCSGDTARVLGCVVKAPSTPGALLRSLRWGQVHQLAQIGRELLTRPGSPVEDQETRP